MRIRKLKISRLPHDNKTILLDYYKFKKNWFYNFDKNK